MAPLFLAIEDRFRAALLLSGGFMLDPDSALAPQVDEVNYASRVTVPVLMVNGRYDFGFPVNLSQIPLFNALGTPDSDKKHVLFDLGHGLRDILDRAVVTKLQAFDPFPPFRHLFGRDADLAQVFVGLGEVSLQLADAIVEAADIVEHDVNLVLDDSRLLAHVHVLEDRANRVQQRP